MRTFVRLYGVRTLPIGERKRAYEDVEPCDHDYDEDEDAGEYVCVHCGERERIPLDKIIRQ